VLLENVLDPPLKGRVHGVKQTKALAVFVEFSSRGGGKVRRGAVHRRVKSGFRLPVRFARLSRSAPGNKGLPLAA